MHKRIAPLFTTALLLVLPYQVQAQSNFDLTNKGSLNSNMSSQGARSYESSKPATAVWGPSVPNVAVGSNNGSGNLENAIRGTVQMPGASTLQYTYQNGQLIKASEAKAVFGPYTTPAAVTSTTGKAVWGPSGSPTATPSTGQAVWGPSGSPTATPSTGQAVWGPSGSPAATPSTGQAVWGPSGSPTATPSTGKAVFGPYTNPPVKVSETKAVFGPYTTNAMSGWLN